MSVTVSNCQKINRDPSNSSPGKHLWSFSKTKRFEGKTPANTTFSYDLKRDFFKRQFVVNTKTTFGVQRPDIFYCKEKLSKPTPVHYNIPASFNSARAGSRCSRTS